MDEFINRNYGFVKSIVIKTNIKINGYDIDDLIQYSLLKLVEAYDKYDSTKGKETTFVMVVVIRSLRSLLLKSNALKRTFNKVDIEDVEISEYKPYKIDSDIETMTKLFKKYLGKNSNKYIEAFNLVYLEVPDRVYRKYEDRREFERCRNMCKKGFELVEKGLKTEGLEFIDIFRYKYDKETIITGKYIEN